jgi:hypothetical protein
MTSFVLAECTISHASLSPLVNALQYRQLHLYAHMQTFVVNAPTLRNLSTPLPAQFAAASCPV